jgi:hypothetical protein
MLRSLICKLFGHRGDYVYDRLPDDTPVLCWTCCGAYTVRETSDPRPVAPTGTEQFQVPAWRARGARAQAKRAHADRTLTTCPKIHKARLSA